MTMTVEQAVYSAAFTQALAAVCRVQTCHVRGRTGLTYTLPTHEQAEQAKAWAEAAVRAWHTAHETPGFERF